MAWKRRRRSKQLNDWRFANDTSAISNQKKVMAGQRIIIERNVASYRRWHARRDSGLIISMCAAARLISHIAM